ncbi:Catenin-beta-like protein [Cladorrhinum samala]|uniref:Catenin-beta-like protein n=1 Tax=Cladorrhinum samala TaxID=585594 RepID=A0AAV9HK28_9PEZI|nr:Catenin-beta-like protein [Cladorrhinum samala]
MTSIDEIFQKSGIPSKRKLDPIRDPTEVYKSAKLSSNGHSRHAQVDDADDDLEAGPAPPPDDDEGDYGPAAPPEDEDGGDDDEGRFFGGGITAQEKEILDYMDDPSLSNPSALPDDDSKIDQSWLKKTALAFEKKISRNAELRARYESDPSKFIESEADLDSAIKSLSILSEHSTLYPLFAKLGCVGSLVSLLAHENTDIAIDAIEIIGELTDEDVAASDEDWNALVDGLLESDLLGLLLSNLSRLDEEAQEADREGVYHALSVIENLCSRPEVTETIGSDEPLLKWLLSRASKAEKPVTQNKQYSAEILAILVSSSSKNRRSLTGLEAVDSLLQLVAPYRRRDPDKTSGDEEEYVQNLFEALTSLVDETEGKTKFLEAEGVELCLIMLKEGGKKLVKPAALKLLDRAASSSSSSSSSTSSSSSSSNPKSNSDSDSDPRVPPASLLVCQKIVEAGGLKPVFTMFMKKMDRFTAERMVNLFASLLRSLPADSPERIRALAKFVEKEYEKTEKMVKLRRDYAAMLAAVDARIEREKQGMDSEEDIADMEVTWLAQRLDEGGLFTLQTIDVVLAWLIAEDDGARKKIGELLADRDEDFGVIKATIEEQIEALDTETEQGRETKEMLTALVQFL